MKIQALCVLALVPLGSCVGPTMLGQSGLPGLYEPGPNGASSGQEATWAQGARERTGGGWDTAASDSQPVDWGVFDAPERPGNYFFRCDVHPDTMTGTFRVQPGPQS